MTKKILVLGAGMCPKPGVQYLAEHGFQVTLASRTLETAVKMINKIKEDSKVKNLDITAQKCNVETDDEVLDKLIASHDMAISFLPYIYHPKAAKLSIKYKKHFFTASYVSEDMKKLEKDAIEAGVILCNELGVDPGTDHMSAKKIIDAVHKAGGKIVSFTSYCGGLPAPEDNNNPFGYKFSWAPRGVLLASRNSATFLEDGKDVFIDGKDLFDNYKIFKIEGLGSFEGYPNRNSKQYIDIYDIPETKTIIRGTFRNIGWCPTIKKIADMGYLGIDKIDLAGKTYKQLAQHLLGTNSDNLREEVAKKFNLKIDDPILDRLEWVGLFSDTKIPQNIETALDALCHIFQQKLNYNKGERDMLLMRHEFIAEYSDRREKLSSTMIDYGIKDGDSSMSRTVSLPVAICVRLVAEGKVKLKPGINVPTIPELYLPILNELDQLGIKFVEKTEEIQKLK